MLYVMSDIHGHLQRFESIMDQIKLGKGDHLFVLGDVIDIHPDGIQILQKLLRMTNVTLLLGNHELMMCRAVYKPATDAALDHFHHAYTSQPRHYMSSLADRLSYISAGTYQELVLDTSQGASSISLE